MVIHLFSSCRFVKKILKIFGDNFSVNLADMDDMCGKIKAQTSARLSKVGKVYWDCTFHSLVWGLWMERNMMDFEEKERSDLRILNCVKELIWSWGLSDIEAKK